MLYSGDQDLALEVWENPTLIVRENKLYLRGINIPLYDQIPPAPLDPTVADAAVFPRKKEGSWVRRDLYDKKVRVMFDQSLQTAKSKESLLTGMDMAVRPIISGGLYTVMLSEEEGNIHSANTVRGELSKKFGSPLRQFKILSPRGIDWIGIYKPAPRKQ